MDLFKHDMLFKNIDLIAKDRLKLNNAINT